MPTSFNPRLPGGRRHVWPVAGRVYAAFQSTPSGGKATATPLASAITPSFNPRLPGGRRPVGYSVSYSYCDVSIHAFRGEGDERYPQMPQNSAGFNPRLPGGRRLRRMFPIVDLTIRFNPRLPGGRRPRRRSNRRDSHTFQSTPSGGKATVRRARLLPVVRRFNPRLPGGRRQRDRGHAPAG